MKIKVRNPVTGRMINKGGITHRKLLKSRMMRGGGHTHEDLNWVIDAYNKKFGFYHYAHKKTTDTDTKTQKLTQEDEILYNDLSSRMNAPTNYWGDRMGFDLKPGGSVPDY